MSTTEKIPFGTDSRAMDEATFESLLSQASENAEKNFKNSSGIDKFRPPAGKYMCQGQEIKVRPKESNGETHLLLFLPCKILEGEYADKVHEWCINSSQPVSLKIGKVILQKMTGEWANTFNEMARLYKDLWPKMAFEMEITYREGYEYPNETFSNFIDVTQQ